LPTCGASGTPLRTRERFAKRPPGWRRHGTFIGEINNPNIPLTQKVDAGKFAGLGSWMELALPPASPAWWGSTSSRLPTSDPSGIVCRA
jgi:hypothetical protein